MICQKRSKILFKEWRNTRMNYDDKLKNIIDAATKNKKRDYRVYEMYKRQIEALNLDCEQYEKAIIKLVDVLKV